MADHFPYNLESRPALIRLVDEDFPDLGVTDTTVVFRNLYFSPTMNTPGRTFITMDLPDEDKSFDYVYRRLSLDLALGGPVELTLDNPITPKKIAEELNAKYDFHLTDMDVSFSETPLTVGSSGVIYRMRAKEGSFVWYGSLVVRVVLEGPLPSNILLMENGDPLLMENGEPFLLETA